MKQNILLKEELLKNDTIVEYLNKNKKLSLAMECLLLAETGVLLQKQEGILQYQNTNMENYPDILKDFFSDVNKSATYIINSLKLIHSDEVLSPVLHDVPILAGHKIHIGDDDIISLRVKNLCDGYFKWINGLYHELFILVQDAKDKKVMIEGLSNNDIFRLLDFLPKITSVYENMHPLMVKSNIGKILKKINIVSIKSQYPGAAKAIHITLKQNESSFHYLYASINFYDEKITNKKDLLYFIPLKDKKPVEIFSKNSASKTMRKSSVSYKFDPEFSISFYLKKKMIESVTKNEILPFMSSIKDYLFRDKFKDDTRKGVGNYNKDHPTNIKNAAKLKFDTSVELLFSSFADTKKLLKAENKISSTERYTFNEWKIRLGNPKLFYGYVCSDPSAFGLSELKSHVENAVRVMLDRIFEENLKLSTSEAFLNTIYEENFIHSIIIKILDYAYRETGLDTSLSSLPKWYRERSTFHTELKDSIVVDFRQDSKVQMNEAALLMVDSNNRFGELIEVLRSHPYHNYYEFDKEVFSHSSQTSVPFLIDYFKNASMLSPSVPFRCAFKFRKLGNYKALGIYFSHTKTIGIDFRNGINSYVHELAHHIDLNGFRQERGKVVSLLYPYFRSRIRERTDYYLKSEELIARGAEVAMVLMAASYRELKIREPNPVRLINKLKDTYGNSRQSAYMKSWEEYFPKEMYVDVESLVLSGDTFLLDVLLEYFESYWSNDTNGSMILKDVSVKYFGNTELKYSASHYSYDYDHCGIYKIKHSVVSKKVFLDNLFSSFL